MSDIPESDIRIDLYRGGDSALRLTHIPTGVVITVPNEQSQMQSKAAAMRLLEAELRERAGPDVRAALPSCPECGHVPHGDHGCTAGWGDRTRTEGCRCPLRTPDPSPEPAEID